MANVLRFNQSVKFYVTAADPSSPENGEMWYNSTSGEFKLWEAGAARTLDSNLDAHLADAAGKHDASQIDFEDDATSAKNVSAGSVEAAITALDDSVGDFTAATYSNYTDPTSHNVVAHLNAIDTALAAAGGTSFDDATFKIIDSAGDSLGANFDVSAVDTADKTITMPNANVDLGDIATNTSAIADNMNGAGAVTDTAIAKFSGTGGKDVQNSGVLIDGSDNITGAAGISMSGALDVPSAQAFNIGASVGANSLTLGGATSTVVVAGDLTVSGTTTTVNSTTLEVADKNINVNNGGSDASSEGAGLNVERVGTDGSLIYKDASASKWAAGPVGSEIDLADVSSTQTFTNKSIDAGQLTGSIVDARVQESNVTQHEAALSITESQISDLQAYLVNLSEDATPTLGGDLDASAYAIFDAAGLKLGSSASNFYLEKYVHAVSLADNQAAAAEVSSSLTFAHASYEGAIIDYKIKEATTNKVRVGQMFVSSNGTDTSLADTSADTGDLGVSFSAVINAGNTEIKFTSTSTGNIRTASFSAKYIKA